MIGRDASCSCRKLRVRRKGDPVRVSIYEERKHAWVAFNEPAPIDHDW